MNRFWRPIKLHKAILCLTTALVCFALLFPAVCVAENRDVLTVGVPVDRCPVFYRDAGTGEIAGIGVDLMRIAAGEAGYDVVFSSIEGDTIKEALDRGTYNLVMPFGSAIESASGQSTVVSENLIRTPFTLLTDNRTELPPLNSLHIGMLNSLAGAAETVRQLFPGITITLYDTMADSVKALRADEVDALLHNSYVWSYMLQKPSYNDLTVQPAAMFSMDFRAGTLDTPAGRETIERLNSGIDGISDAHRQAIVLDYTTRRLYRYDLSDYIYSYGLIVLLGVCFITAVVMFVLERQRILKLEQEEKMRRLIDFDPLTGVLSMEGFRKRVEELLREHPGLSYILTYVNIRDFKYINDSLGKAAGDELLRFWAYRNRDSLTDREAVGRIGGDRMAVLTHADSEDRIIWYEQNVINPVRNYFIERGKEYRVQVCGGIYVLTPEDYREIDVDHMLDYARVAEKRVRETRRDGYEFYNPEQWEKGKRVSELINHLPAALRNGDIHVWYQPQVDGETGEITGAEALCRWDHDKLGWIQPTDFIETLEESGMIYDLDCFVWDKVCRDLRRWNEQGEHRVVSVNVSRCDIRGDRDIPGHFRDLVSTYQLTPDQLRIEITETAFVEKPADLINATVRFREYGFEVEMDDFGSGYSSLHMLKEVPVDRIKLDLHFLTDSGDPEKGSIIVSHMIRMVQSLGMKMIAEGVETAEQAEFLRSQGCPDMQGFYFYRPIPVDEFDKLKTR